MKERIPSPGQAGRVLIAPLNGQPAFYATISMADNPVEPGDPISPATLLKDSTAALYGLGRDAVPDDVLQMLALDYITEEGTSGIWTYRKWASGIAECWGVYEASGINASKLNYQGFYYSEQIKIPYPFDFVAPPALTTDGGSTSSMNFVREFGATAAATSFHVVCLVSGQTSVSVRVALHARGRWK